MKKFANKERYRSHSENISAYRQKSEKGGFLLNLDLLGDNDCRNVWYRLLKENKYTPFIYDMNGHDVALIAEIALKVFPIIYNKNFSDKGKRRKNKFNKYPVSFDEISMKLINDKENLRSIFNSFTVIDQLDTTKCFAHNIRYAFCYIYVNSSIEDAESFLETYLEHSQCPFGSKKNINNILKAVNSVEMDKVPFELWLNMYEVSPLGKFDAFFSRKIDHTLCI